jgi:hypothetical protein
MFTRRVETIGGLPENNECSKASRFSSDVSCVRDDERIPRQHLKLHFNEVISENRKRTPALPQSVRARIFVLHGLFFWGFARVDTVPVAC